MGDEKRKEVPLLDKEHRGNLVAFDPGGTTGVVICSGEGKLNKWYQFHQHELYHFLSVDIWRVAEQHGVGLRLSIIESFNLFPSKAKAKIGSSFPEVEVIGAIKYVMEQHGVEVITQPPGVKKFFMPVARLKYYGYDIVGEHARDAARHALYYFVFKAKILPLPKEEGPP